MAVMILSNIISKHSQRLEGMMIEYAIYKGEKFIAEGTADELAKLLNVKPTTIKWWSRPVNSRRDKGNRKIAVKL